MVFERHIGVDWSGAGEDAARNGGLAIALGAELIAPPRYTRWSRAELEACLFELLAPTAPRAVVGVDAALSFPYGFQTAVFGVRTWSETVAALGAAWQGHKTARAMAHALNATCDPCGPFRFDDARNDHRFNRVHDVAYFRAADLLMPQCISPFYLGSGACVGFHTLTFLQTLRRLMTARERGEVRFRVWPQEGVILDTDEHVIAEAYPALFPVVPREDISSHERDALRITDWMTRQSDWGEIFRPPSTNMGRRTDCSWSDQLSFEGWVLGV